MAGWRISFIPYYMTATARWSSPPVEEAITVLGEAGYDGVEWMLGQHFRDAEELERLVALTRRRGLAVSNIMCWQDLVTRDDASAPLAIFKVDLVVLLSIASGVSYQTADSQGTLSIRRADQEIDAKFESPGPPPVRWQANLDDFLNALNNFRSTGV